MNEPASIGEIVDKAPAAMELQDVPTNELHQQLSEAIGMTEQAVTRVAHIWRELSRRGEDMSCYRFALAQFMPAVADGRLLPRLVVNMAGQTRALTRLAELPVGDQRALLSGQTIEVYKGEDTVEEKRLDDLTYSEIALAIRDGHIRSAAEQKLAAERSSGRRRKSRPGRPVRVSVTGDKMLRVGKLEIELERVLAELRTAGVID